MSSEGKYMTVTFHSMRDCVVKTIQLTEEEVAEMRADYDALPFNNGFTKFEEFVAWICSYNM